MTVKLRERLNSTDTFTVGNSDIPRGTCAVLNSGVVDASGANAAKFVGITTETRLRRQGCTGGPGGKHGAGSGC